MNKYSRELTSKEKRKIKNFVYCECANYDPEYGCLPLEADCYMCCIGFTGSKLCKYFESAVLPSSPELTALFKRLPTKICKQCGKRFPQDGKRVYCSDECAKAARREQTANRVRKHRQKKTDM